MKKIYLILSGIAITAFIAQGQIKLTYSTHALMKGDSHDFVFTNNTSEGSPGANIVWDFSDLKNNGKTLTSHMINPAGLEKSKEIPEANTIIEEFGNNFYFNVNKDAMEQYGQVSCNTITRYDQPFLKLKFPFTYGDRVSGNFSGTQESTNSQVAINGTYEVEGDGYGTLILPGDITIDNVLRVKQTRIITYENGAAGLTEITYRWYSAGVRYPLLVIIKYKNLEKEYISQTAMYANAGTHLKSATSVSSVELFSKFDVFPNPFDDELTINYSINRPGKVRIELYDTEGKLVKTVLDNKKLGAGDYNVCLGNGETGSKAGIYYIRLTIDNNSVIKKVIKR